MNKVPRIDWARLRFVAVTERWEGDDATCHDGVTAHPVQAGWQAQAGPSGPGSAPGNPGAAGATS